MLFSTPEQGCLKKYENIKLNFSSTLSGLFEKMFFFTAALTAIISLFYFNLCHSNTFTALLCHENLDFFSLEI